MPTRVRVGSTRPGAASAQPPQTYEGTTSGYGATRGDSVGYNPRNPYAFSAAQAAKAYSTGPDQASDLKYRQGIL